MIVVAIIGILAAIALPAYQQYTIRAYVAEGLQLAGGAKVALLDYWTENGRLAPVDYPGTGKPPKDSYTYQFKPTHNVKAIRIRGAQAEDWSQIQIFYGGKNKVLEDLGIVIAMAAGYDGIDKDGTVVTPLSMHGGKVQNSAGGGSIVWSCLVSAYSKQTSFSKMAKYVPSRCRYKHTNLAK
ncbi:MAG: pilin, partial [Zoogloeaceae bacterium]|jgi:Tfp pilus assembly major pilin PilA|nr:pilin [Zoogloeaceae bacterium]